MTAAERLFKVSNFLRNFCVLLLIFHLADTLDITLANTSISKEQDRNLVSLGGGLLSLIVSLLTVLQRDLPLQSVPRQPLEVLGDVVQVTPAHHLQVLLLQAGGQVLDALPADVLQGGADLVPDTILLLQRVVELSGNGVCALLVLLLDLPHLVLVTPLAWTAGNLCRGPERRMMIQFTD